MTYDPAYQRAYYQANKEKLDEQNRQWELRNKLAKKNTYTRNGPTRCTAKAQELYDLICAQPGMEITDLAKQLGITRSAGVYRLASLEAQGLLLSEDQYGNLYPFT